MRRGSIYFLQTAENSHNYRIRAYRMKLDEWGLRKNASTHTRKKRRLSSTEPQASKSSRRSRLVASSSSFDSSSSLDERAGKFVEASSSESHKVNAILDFDAFVWKLLAKHDCSLQDGTMRVDELMDLLSLPSHRVLREYHFLEILLLKWQPDGAYLEAALQYAQHMDVGKLSAYLDFHVFKIIDAKLGPREKNELTKACLRRYIEAIGADISGFYWVSRLKIWLSPLVDAFEAPL